MNTSPVNNPTNLLQSSAPNAGRQDAASASDTPSFNQVLSREMSGNAGSANSGSNNVNAGNDVAKPAQKDGGNGDSTKSEAAKEQDVASAETGKKIDDDKVTSGKDVEKDDDEIDDTAASDLAGIAAFVAALTSAKATPAETAATSAATAAAGAPIAKVTLTDSDIKTRNDTIDIAAGIAGSETADGDKDAIGKKSDFVSALDKAGANASDQAKAAAGGIKAEADAITNAATAAAAQTVKGLDTPGGNPLQTLTAIAASAMQPRNDAQAINSSALLPQVGGPGWDQALGQKVVWMAKGAEQIATLTLNPPDLGPMQVTVNVANNQATATFTAHQPEVRHALEASMPRLREMLNEAGIQLGQSSVNGGTPNQQGGDGRPANGGRRAQSNDAVESAVHVSHVPTPANGTGMVDTFA